MAENGAGAAQQAAQVQMKILGQFIRDMSFENVMAQKGGTPDGQPDVSVQVNLDAKKRQPQDQYEVMVKLKIESKSKPSGEMLFVLEVDYVGIFNITNIPDDQLHPFLMIECPRMMFPFLRRIVSDVTQDGGFPPLLLDPIDFMRLYQQNQQAAAASAAEGQPN